MLRNLPHATDNQAGKVSEYPWRACHQINSAECPWSTGRKDSSRISPTCHPPQRIPERMSPENYTNMPSSIPRYIQQRTQTESHTGPHSIPEVPTAYPPDFPIPKWPINTTIQHAGFLGLGEDVASEPGSPAESEMQEPRWVWPRRLKLQNDRKPYTQRCPASARSAREDDRESLAHERPLAAKCINLLRSSTAAFADHGAVNLLFRKLSPLGRWLIVPSRVIALCSGPDCQNCHTRSGK